MSCGLIVLGCIFLCVDVSSALSQSTHACTNNDNLQGICTCKPGRAGDKCQFSMKDIYQHHNPYANFIPRPLDLQGWSPGKSVYDDITMKLAPQFIVEVGCWKGLSASYLASYLKDSKAGMLVCVDTWLGAVEFWTKHILGPDDTTRDLKLVNGYPSVYYDFLSNMVHLGLQEYVVPFPVTSPIAADFFKRRNQTVDLVHIDASHEYEDCLADIKMWWPRLRPGGVLLGDDFSPGWPGVIQAVEEFAGQTGVPYTVTSEKWMMEKPQSVSHHEHGRRHGQ